MKDLKLRKKINKNNLDHLASSNILKLKKNLKNPLVKILWILYHFFILFKKK